MVRQRSPKPSIAGSSPATPAIILDPSGPCPVCHPVENGVDTNVTRHWKSITKGFGGPTTWWMSVAGVWFCKACHPPACPELVSREIEIGVSSNGKTAGFGPENRGSNPCTPARKPDPKYFLTEDQEEWCKQHAAELLEWNKKNTVDRKIDKSRSEYEVDLEGMIGQYGYFRILGRDPEKEMRILKTIDPGYDDMINSKRIQIKATKHPMVYMILSEKAQSRCDFAVRMQVVGRMVRAAGFLSVSEFRSMAKIDEKITVYENNPCVHESKFHHIDELIGACL